MNKDAYSQLLEAGVVHSAFRKDFYLNFSDIHFELYSNIIMEESAYLCLRKQYMPEREAAFGSKLPRAKKRTPTR